MTAIDSALTFADQHRTTALIAGGLVVAVLLLLALIARNQRGRSAALTFAASVIALGFSAEGMWEVATGALHLDTWQAALLFAFAEILMLFEADRARQKIAEKRDPRRHIRAVWVIALVAGLAAASHADNLSGQVIRLFMPLAVAWQWSSRIKDDLPEVARQESSWIWTPRRVGVELGLLKPGAADDLSDVFSRRAVDRMVRLARLIDSGSERLVAVREGKLRRLAEGATAQMLDEVRERHQRGASARARILAQPVAHPVAQPPRMPAQVEIPQVARPAAHVAEAPARRGQVVLRSPAEPVVELSADEREEALARAVARVRGGESVRGAAKAEDVPESTLRTRIKTNGHSFEPADR
ncbi:helix-turn-helix domain-containing protein [Micromonospora krabiensis]|uniref:Helix-turn-helix, Psq domain n=1 Tax=Micromonospora krabiensis TaxID=307121 RepID=A0A1C3N4R9_9ACTN|nr:helix-turn-helix domain-containing protein [Micromonospora krabiensis]SBV27590.1 helix-turn-helix, Psq domain [Micromonospora krabiensis]